MKRTSALLVVSVLVVLGDACTSGTGGTPTTEIVDPNATRATSRATTPATSAVALSTTLPTTPATSAGLRCRDETAGVRIDDEPADDQLLDETQLPAGTWARDTSVSCWWAFSANEALGEPPCTTGSATQLVRPDEIRTGAARDAWNDDARNIRIEHRGELFPSPMNVDAVRAMLGGPEREACVRAMVEARLRESGRSLQELTVGPIEGLPVATEVGLTWIDGFTLTETDANEAGQSDVSTVRVVVLGLGGGMSSLTLTELGAREGAGTVTPEEWTSVVGHAADDLASTF